MQGRFPIVDAYLSIRVNRVVYVGNCGDVKHLTVPKNWAHGNTIDIALKQSHLCEEYSGKDCACDVLGQTHAK
jgi:hypothetical protein